MNKNKHIGSDIDEFLKEEEIYEECCSEAMKRVIDMKIQKDSKSIKVENLSSKSYDKK